MLAGGVSPTSSRRWTRRKKGKMGLCFGGLNTASRRVGALRPPPPHLIFAVLTRHSRLFHISVDSYVALTGQLSIEPVGNKFSSRFDLNFLFVSDCTAPFFSPLSYYRPFCRSSLLYSVLLLHLSRLFGPRRRSTALVRCGHAADVEYYCFFPAY